MTIRWGIIGCGDVCEVKSGPPLYQLAGSSLRIVMRRDASAAENFALRHGVKESTDDATKVIEHPEVDAVYVATPPGSHLQYALAVAKAGKPCYVEKPMARSAAECQQMVEGFRSAQQPLFVAYYRRALPRFVQVREILLSRRLGALRTIQHTYQGRVSRHGQPNAGPSEASWRETVAQSGGGLFLDLGSHVLDLIDYLCGPLSDVHGLASHRSSRALTGGVVEDTVVASFRAGRDVLGGVRHHYHTAQAFDCMEIVGSAGSLRFSVFGTEPLLLTIGEQQQALETLQPKHVQAPLLRTIVEQLRGGNSECPSTGQSALRTSEAMDQILSAYYGGRHDDFWNRRNTWPAELLERKLKAL